MIPFPLLLILAILAAYRVAFLVALEEGPFGMAEGLRTWAFRRHPSTWIERGVNCVYCVSFWTSAAAAGLLLWGGAVGTFLLLWGGIAGAVVVVHRFTQPRID